MPHTTPTPLSDGVRRAAALAGPTAVLSLVLFFVTLAVHGDAAADLTRTPLGVTSSALALLSLALLLLGLVHLAAGSAVLQDRAGRAAVLAAGLGTLLLAGGAWTQLVVLPALAVDAPRLAEEGHTLVTSGYIASFLAAGLGWLLVALRLRHDELVVRSRTRLLMVGAVLMVAPLPTRWCVLAIAVTLLVRDRTAAAVVRRPVPAHS